MWANDPSMAAIVCAHSWCGVSFNEMRVVSVGNGFFPPGSVASQFDNAGGVALIDPLFNMLFTTQSNTSQEVAAMLVGPENIQRIDVPLNQIIDLNDVKALELLPPLAEKCADEKAAQKLKQFLKQHPYRTILHKSCSGHIYRHA